MIVVYRNTGWEIVTQRAHGILAAQLAVNWKISARPDRWLETLLAVAEHDDAENELDGESLLTANGGPLNFSMKKFDLSHCKKLCTLCTTKSRYITLLTSLHMEFLYRKDAATDKEAYRFLAEQKRLQTSLRKQLRLTQNESLKIYSFLEWCDAFSLLLCQQKIPDENRAIEISTGPDGTIYHLFKLKSGQLCVDPWPFEAGSFSVRAESRIIQKLEFSSSAELRRYFTEAPVAETEWKFCKKPAYYKKPKKI